MDYTFRIELVVLATVEAKNEEDARKAIDIMSPAALCENANNVDYADIECLDAY